MTYLEFDSIFVYILKIDNSDVNLLIEGDISERYLFFLFEPFIGSSEVRTSYQDS